MHAWNACKANKDDESNEGGDDNGAAGSSSADGNNDAGDEKGANAESNSEESTKAYWKLDEVGEDMSDKELELKHSENILATYEHMKRGNRRDLVACVNLTR